jgi:hypothetical protein
MRESDEIPKNSFVYIIVEGEMKLEACHNPVSKMDSERKFNIDSKKVDKTYDTAMGKAHMSRTLTRS